MTPGSRPGQDSGQQLLSAALATPFKPVRMQWAPGAAPASRRFGRRVAGRAPHTSPLRGRGLRWPPRGPGRGADPGGIGGAPGWPPRLSTGGELPEVQQEVVRLGEPSPRRRELGARRPPGGWGGAVPALRRRGTAGIEAQAVEALSSLLPRLHEGLKTDVG